MSASQADCRAIPPSGSAASRSGLWRPNRRDRTRHVERRWCAETGGSVAIPNLVRAERVGDGHLTADGDGRVARAGIARDTLIGGLDSKPVHIAEHAAHSIAERDAGVRRSVALE